MNKQFYKIIREVNKDIKVGDTVKLIDGSGLSNIDNPEKEYYIVFSYPDLTGIIRTALGQIECVVLETGITDIITSPNNFVKDSYCYGVDIRIKVGNTEFYTCSKFVKKI